MQVGRKDLDSQMTQAEPVANQEAKPNESDAQYALDFVKRICMQGVVDTPRNVSVLIS